MNLEEMTAQIRKMMGADVEVKLECIDREGFIGHGNGENRSHNIRLLKTDLVVTEIDFKGDLKIGSSNHWILRDEIKYFCIKLADDTPEEIAKEFRSFDALIDTVVGAYKDEKLIILHMGTKTISIRETSDRGLSKSIKKGDNNGYKEFMDFIDSLYIETFVIDDINSVLNCKGGANLVFSNGIEGEFLEYYDDEETAGILFLETEKGFNVPFALLKGAVVTQRRGN